MQQSAIIFVARVLMALVFILGGFGKITGDMAGFAGYIESAGFPGLLAWPAALFELVAGVLLLVGFQTRWVALALAGFSVFTAVFYHVPGDNAFFKNIAMAGGYLMFVQFGAGKLSIDRR